MISAFPAATPVSVPLPPTPFLLRAQRISCRLARTVRRALGLERTVYVAERVSEYRSYWETAAEILGAKFEPLTDDIWEVRLGGRRTRISNYIVATDDAVTRRIASDKLLCHGYARRAGVPVPEHFPFSLATLSRAEEFLAAREGHVVVKPQRDSSSGLGITLGVRTVRELRSAAVLASLFSRDLLVEEMVPGESYRLLFLGGTLLHAVRRRGLRVVGDGRSTVKDLLTGLGLSRLAAESVVLRTLQAQGLSPASVPAAGASVLAHGLPQEDPASRELRTVYDEVATHLISPPLAGQLGRLVREVGSEFAGVDIVSVDPSRPLAEVGGAFIEINTTPGIHHHYVDRAAVHDHTVPIAVLRYLLDRCPPWDASLPALIAEEQPRPESAHLIVR